MRFGFIGSRPLHLVPLSSLPLHTLLFSLFFHVLLSSCLFISSFFSFACVRALLHTFKHRFQVAQVFTMRWASSGVPVHLVPLSSQPHALLSRLVLLSCLHSFVLRAHTCTLALTLDLRLPSGRRVCVCPLWSQGSSRIVLIFRFSAGGWSVLQMSPANEDASVAQ